MTKSISGKGVFPPITISAAQLLTHNGDADFRKLVDNLVLFASQIQNVRQALSKALGVTPPQYNMLMIIAHHDQASGMTVGEMAEKMNVTPSFIVVETNKLVSRGLVHKHPSTVDRRRINLQLTEKAISLLTKIGPLQRDVNDRLFGSLTGRDFRSLGSIIEKLIMSYEPALEEAGSYTPLARRKSRP
jgi:DNA-binding MarR family transcriptional regulator